MIKTMINRPHVIVVASRCPPKHKLVSQDVSVSSHSNFFDFPGPKCDKSRGFVSFSFLKAPSLDFESGLIHLQSQTNFSTTSMLPRLGKMTWRQVIPASGPDNGSSVIFSMGECSGSSAQLFPASARFVLNAKPIQFTTCDFL